jgi:VWFA-related protein
MRPSQANRERKMLRAGKWAWALVLLAGVGVGQQSSTPPATQDTAQDQLPSAPTPQNNVPPPASLPQPQPPTVPAPAAEPKDTGSFSPPEPSPPNERDQMMYTMRVETRLVVVPITVKDTSGHLVEGLTKRDFAVFEDGVPQQIRFFTSDPFPLSAAVVLDVGLPDQVLRKVNDTLPALAAAFSQFDEVAFYTFGNSVKKELDFSAVTDRYATSIKRLKRQGQPSGAPVAGGPLGQPSPSINGRPVDPNVPTGGGLVYVPYREAHVLNDAILAAAQDLSQRPKDRRKLIFVISDGKEIGSRANYPQVEKVLLSNAISVYGVAVGDSSMPILDTVQRVHLPGHGYGNLLPRYTTKTGGDIFPEFDRNAIETAYARVTQQARNQYTLGYTAKASGPNNTYRNIEVIVHRPGLKVHAKEGYYPLPIASAQ